MTAKQRVVMWIVLLVAVVYAGGLLRYLRPADAQSEQRITLTAVPPGHEVAYLSGGCFWSMEAMFRQLKGVDSVIPGFSGGTVANPTYDDVCTETTGHAETIRVVYDPRVISYPQLLKIYFTCFDPTQLDRQGDDVGTSYRSIVFYTSAAQRSAAEDAKREAGSDHPGESVVTEIDPYRAFYPAEQYHQNYYNLHPDTPYCAFVVAPKVSKFEKHWRAYLKTS